MSITFDRSDPFYVEHEGSIAVVWNVRENEESIEAARGMVVLLAGAAGGVEQVVLIDNRTASVFAFPRANVAPVVAQPPH